PEDNPADKTFIQKHMLNDPTIQALSYPRRKGPRPQTHAEQFIKHLQASLLSVIICLRPTTEETTEPVPIGTLTLSNPWGPDASHHLHATLGTSLAEKYRGQGYGGEAINWALDWAFLHAGLHRVGLTAFGFNDGAAKLYRKLGFVEEGREREVMWHSRGWWDVIHFGILEGEWEVLRGLKEKSDGK
ncbi:acyl-CoA N-acyltransferase, partial [Aspergillus sclerotioniger CBS 115572]